MITQEELKHVLFLNESEGRFYWNVNRRGIVKGSQAGSFDAHGYGQIRFNGRVYKEHRLVWLYITGEWPSNQIDHKNHVRRDNRFENLRVVDNIENHKNRPMQKTNTSGFVGVSFDKRLKKWEAYITANKKRKCLGYFKTIENAISARKAANNKYEFHENHGVGYGISKKKRYSTKLLTISSRSKSFINES